MSESDTDIYDDLPDFLFGEKEELQANINELIEKNDSLHTRLQKTTLIKKELEEKHQALSLNISMLFKTAQAEISRKENTIKSLREELNKCQCRKRRRNGEKVHNTSQNKVNRNNRIQKRDPSPVKLANKNHEMSKNEFKTRLQLKNTLKENIVPVKLINSKQVTPVTLFSQRMSLRIKKLTEQEKLAEEEKLKEETLKQSKLEKDVPKLEKETLKENPSSISNVQNVNGVKEDIQQNKVDVPQIVNEIKDSKNRQDEVHKTAGKRITRRSRCPINPISKDWNVKKSSPPYKTPTMQPPVKKIKIKKPPNKLMIDIFGSPTKWADSSSNDDDIPKTDFTSPAVFEDSCSAQIDNNQFSKKIKTVEELNSAIKDQRPFQNIKPKPHIEDTLMGQFETTTQFISSLTVVQNQISPLTTPIKTPICELSNISDKPINILKPRKTPRIVTKKTDQPLIKSFSLKDSFVSEQEEKVKNLKTDNDKIMHVSPKNEKKKQVEWVLKRLDFQPKPRIKRHYTNISPQKSQIHSTKNAETSQINENKTSNMSNLDSSPVNVIKTPSIENSDPSQINTYKTPSTKNLEPSQIITNKTQSFKNLDQSPINAIKTPSIDNSDPSQINLNKTPNTENLETSQIITNKTQSFKNFDQFPINAIKTPSIENSDPSQINVNKTPVTKNLEPSQINTNKTPNIQNLDQSQLNVNKTPSTQKLDSSQTIANTTPTAKNLDTSKLKANKSAKSLDQFQIISNKSIKKLDRSQIILNKTPSTQKLDSSQTIANKTPITKNLDTSKLNANKSAKSLDQFQIISNKSIKKLDRSQIILNKTPSIENLDTSRINLNKTPSIKNLHKINLATPQTKENPSKTDEVFKIIRSNRKIRLSNSDNPGQVVVAKYRPIHFSSTDL